jgi:hypothetical protein
MRFSCGLFYNAVNVKEDEMIGAVWCWEMRNGNKILEVNLVKGPKEDLYMGR